MSNGGADSPQHHLRKSAATVGVAESRLLDPWFSRALPGRLKIQLDGGLTPMLTRLFVAVGITLIAFVGPAVAQSYTFTTFAGVLPQKGSADGSDADARFTNPAGIAIDPAGNIYVADTFNYTVRKITPTGVVTTIAGLAGTIGSADGPRETARFGELYGLAADANGNIFVSDFTNHSIRKISPAGSVTTFAGLSGTAGSVDGTTATARFRNPAGIALDADGTIFVADRGNRIVRKITSGGVVTTLAGLFGVNGSTDGTGNAARFNALTGLAIDRAGNVYVIDNSNYNVRKITAAGAVSTVAGLAGTSGSTNGVGTAARFNSCYGITVDGNDNVFIADTLNESIRKITPDGTVTLFAGTAGLPGSTNGLSGITRFYRPYAICADPANNLYIADTNNQSIRKLTPAGTSTTFAGPGGNFGSTDGPGATARFNLASSIASDRAGNLYVSDSVNATVRKITPAGVVSTFAGEAGLIGYLDGGGSGARLGYPYGLAVDSSDNIYVADTIFNVVRKITSTGTVSTVAGIGSLTPGSADGPALAARFNSPRGVTIDRDGNLYVADTTNQTIRRVSAAGLVTTLAGSTGLRGSADGPGNIARFSDPVGIACEPDGSKIYIADPGNSAIRQITSAGIVTTLAGLPGTPGTADGNGPAARFTSPTGITYGPQGNLFVVDSGVNLIRMVTPAGNVSTIAGEAGALGGTDGSGTAAHFNNPLALTFDPAGALFIVDSLNNRIAKGVLDRIPVVTAITPSLTLATGSSLTLAATATGGGLQYQWRFNGTAISGATGNTYAIARANPGSIGNFTVQLTNSAGNTTSSPVAINVITTDNVGRVTNLAIRSQAGTGAQTLIVGVAIGGTGTTGAKPVLLRAVGPTLGVFGVPGILSDPRLEIFSGITKINENDDWAGNAQVSSIGTAVGAFALSAPTSKDAALYNPSFASGSYSVQITGGGGTTGVALAEIYDATSPTAFTPTTPRLTNVSARTQVGTGGDILIAGFTLGGLTAKTVLIRAIGPTLAAFGVPGALFDPKLELFSGPAKIQENDDWGGSAAIASTSLSVGAFPLATSSRDAVLLVTLAPGSYTAQVTGANNTTGVALIEIYDVP